MEFLFVPNTQQYCFMEVNTRLQVEHAVTELTTGLDLVKLQLHIARGGRLEGQPPASRGHALEVRLNAEDAEAGFIPAPGRIELFRVPTHAGLRLDSSVSEGDAIPAEFDSMFAKLISHGQTRSEALAGMTQALEESAIIVAGGATNRAFLLQLLEREEVRQEKLDVGWLDRWHGMEDAEIAVVWDAHIGGYPVCLLGFESRPLPRTGFIATDGPEQWPSGTLFPMASKKTARAINAASNNRPRGRQTDPYRSAYCRPGKGNLDSGRAQRRRLRAQLAEIRNVVRSEKLGKVADEFDQIHSVHRALEVGSLDRIIPASQLRPYLIDAIERGMKREMQRISGSGKGQKNTCKKLSHEGHEQFGVGFDGFVSFVAKTSALSDFTNL